MCGGIMGALSLSLPRPVQRRPAAAAAFVVLYNLGRLAAYASMGAVAGSLGTRVLAAMHPVWAGWAAKLLVAATLVLVGAHLAGLVPRPTGIERLGAPLWRLVEPLGRRLLPVQRPEQALLYGFVWGFLPCGLVYAILLVAFAAPGAQAGALVMASFWLGSLPVMMAAGLFATGLRRLLHRRPLRLGAGLALLALGVAGPFFPDAVLPHLAGMHP
jgi:sulfite exporter TauE/SafE